jgi:hypothetical protein
MMESKVQHSVVDRIMAKQPYRLQISFWKNLEAFSICDLYHTH